MFFPNEDIHTVVVCVCVNNNGLLDVQIKTVPQLCLSCFGISKKK